MKSRLMQTFLLLCYRCWRCGRRLAAQASAARKPALTPIEVYKSPTCGCCGQWVEHVKAAGFAPDVHDMADVSPVKTKAGVPASLQSCHTALVGGYVIEGHVPADVIRRLLPREAEDCRDRRSRHADRLAGHGAGRPRIPTR